MSAINTFLKNNGLTVAQNPCVSPDFCLDWDALAGELKQAKKLAEHPLSRFETAAGAFLLVENAAGDHAWILESSKASALSVLADGVANADSSEGEQELECV